MRRFGGTAGYSLVDLSETTWNAAPLGWDVEYQSPSPGCHSWKTTKWLEWKQKPRRKPGLKLIESDRIYRKREMRFEGNVICICVVMLLYFTHLESDGFKFRPTKVWKTMENQNKQRQPTISFRNKTCVKLFPINRLRNFTNTFQLIGTVHLHSCKRPSLVYIHLQNWFSCWCFPHTPFLPITSQLLFEGHPDQTTI